MKAIQVVHQGHVTAVGFIVEVPAMGLDKARARVLEMLDPADQLLLLPDGRWLLLADTPTDIDSDLAPGLPLVRVRGGDHRQAGREQGKGCIGSPVRQQHDVFGSTISPSVDL